MTGILKSFQLVDIIILAILVIAFIFGLKSKLRYNLIMFIFGLIATYVAVNFHKNLSSTLNFIPGQTLRFVVTYILIIVLVGLAGQFFYMFYASIAKPALSRIFSRLLGSLFNVASCALLIGNIFFIINSYMSFINGTINTSISYKIFHIVFSWISVGIHV